MTGRRLRPEAMVVRDRRMMRLHTEFGLPIAVIAERFGCSASVVHGAIKRVRKADQADPQSHEGKPQEGPKVRRIRA